MRILRFLVDSQNIKKDPTCDFSSIIPGSSGYLYAEFIFSEEWGDKLKVAEFFKTPTSKCYPKKVINGKCEIPNEILDGNLWCVRIVGKRDNIILPTNTISVRQGG